MAFKVNALMKNELINLVINNIAGTTGTAGTASLNLYTGSQPSDADQATSGNLLATLSSISWGSSSAGTASLTTSVNGTNSQTGTAGWGRLETVGAAGTYRIDGDVGTGATCVFIINDPIFSTTGVTVSLMTNTIQLS